MPDMMSYSLDELCALVELPKRTVRYYIQSGLLDRPDGLNRGARYGRGHVERLLFIRKWQQAGLSLERIRELVAEPSGAIPPARRRGPGTIEVWSHLVIREGIELHVEPTISGLSPEQLRLFLQRVQAAYDDIEEQNQERKDEQ